jgi:hypothetical protein
MMKHDYYGIVNRLTGIDLSAGFDCLVCPRLTCLPNLGPFEVGKF